LGGIAIWEEPKRKTLQNCKTKEAVLFSWKEFFDIIISRIG
jgi:hypothetical protein